MDSMQIAAKVTERIGDLPAMPAVVSEVLHLMEDPMVDMGTICNVLQRDPALTAKILRVSNSSYYGMKQYVGTLKLALVVLGAREVRNIVLGVSVFETFGQGKLDAAFPMELWEHSVRVGGLCKNLGGRMRLALQGEDFISGLLHDIGQMILWCQTDEEYEAIYFRFKKDPEALLAEEMATYGFDHADAGAALAMNWNLPVALRDALWLHHPGREDRRLDKARDPMLASLVRVANDATHAQDLADSEAAGIRQDAEAWAMLDSAPSPIPAKDREAVIAEIMDEMAQSPVPTL